MGYQNLDRAFLTFSPPSGDIYIGRQAIAFGAADVVNPTDVLAPYGFDSLDTENRPGVDALRYRIPFGGMGELDFGVVCGDGCSRAESAGRTNQVPHAKASGCIKGITN